MTARPPAALIAGCRGPTLTADEAALFAALDPFGFILFRRNCPSPAAVRSLVASLRDCVGRADAPVLIDQEGGRVARLGAPHWPVFPAPRGFGDQARDDAAAAAAAATENARLIAALLVDLGITVNCAPVLDLGLPETSDAIGDRAFSDQPDIVAMLGAATCDGLLGGGVMPVLKHIPGHGRARVDSHVEQPRVAAAASKLAATDFVPFKALAAMPLAMTAHVVYADFDAERPATVSPTVIDRVIRGEIGFDGLLLSDDISMQALAGPLAGRAEAAWTAGCDVVLHCTGDRGELQALAAVAPPLTDRALAAWRRAQDRLREATGVTSQPRQ